MPEKTVEVAIVFREEGFTHGCKSCFTVHVQGRYAIMLATSGESYFVCEPTVSICCGVKKHWMILCDEKAEARVRLDDINRQIEETGSISSLQLSLPTKMAEA